MKITEKAVMDVAKYLEIAVREIANNQEIVQRQYASAVRAGDMEAVTRLGALWVLFSRRLRKMDE